MLSTVISSEGSLCELATRSRAGLVIMLRTGLGLRMYREGLIGSMGTWSANVLRPIRLGVAERDEGPGTPMAGKRVCVSTVDIPLVGVGPVVSEELLDDN